ncbi:MAG: hypothetical protein NTW96_27550 [Planctomycetia bacterium]|nr:hypothetical protein [Planctomycetia bacterium]
MPTNVDPQTLQRAVQTGFKRLENFRRSRLMFLRAYAGQYYDRDHGLVGNEPLNLIFNAIRVLVPNLVMNFPKHVVKTNFKDYRDYADLMALALDAQARELKIKQIIRQWIVDAIFTLGVVKTGLCESGRLIRFEDQEVDPGSVYTESVSFDNFVFDPAAKRLDRHDCTFIGDKITVPRFQLLDSGLYKNDLIEKLPSVGNKNNNDDSAYELSRKRITPHDADELHECVEVVELWVPRAKALVTVPASGTPFKEYLRTADYYGPDSGPYTYLSFTPPMPDNPMPVPPVGIWYDLHVMANRMAYKIMKQAERQKDVLGYRRASADDAQEVVDAQDGETIAMEDPEGVKTFSFGGQQQSNEGHIAQLQMWFNMMSGNTDALGGIRSDAATATQANILQANGAIGLEDMRDQVYIAAGEEASKRAWYLHTDPLIEIPLTKRVQVPAAFTSGGYGVMPTLIHPATQQDVQIVLTPEARRGDFLNFQFEILFKSMSRLDPQLQNRNTMEFLTKALPSVVQAAQMAAQMGVPFAFSKVLTRIAIDQYGLEWFDEVWYDPDFQQAVHARMQATPGPGGSKGTVLQPNGQPTGLPRIAGPVEQQNAMPQLGSAPGQETMPVHTGQ